jgi:hypothetical protein
MKMAVFWVAAPCSLSLMMEATSTSKTLVNFYQITRRNNPEDSDIHLRQYCYDQAQNGGLRTSFNLPGISNCTGLLLLSIVDFP